MYTSDSGPSTIGPTPKPITKSDRPRVATICEHSNSTVIWLYVDVYRDDVHVLSCKHQDRFYVEPMELLIILTRRVNSWTR